MYMCVVLINKYDIVATRSFSIFWLTHLTNDRMTKNFSSKANSTHFVQVGLDIDGKEQNDNFGSSVSSSADGTTFVVGARYGGGTGQVSVYKYNSTIQSYEKFGLDINGKVTDSLFGFSVSISADGNTFVVGGLSNDANTGLVRVYKFNETANLYSQFGSDINGEAAGDQFGWSVSISADGKTFVVGATYNDANNINSDTGHVRIYKFNETAHLYSQLGPDINGEAANDRFGWSVSMSADATTFIVGAPFNDGNGEMSGQVSVYKYNDTANLYSQFGSDINGKSAGDQFGNSVSISADGKTFVVGARNNDANNINSDTGHVRVYNFNETANLYSQFGSDINGEAAGDQFGWSVSISADGKTFVVGATYNDANNINSDTGHVRIYKFNETAHLYSQLGPDINGEAANDRFGWSVSMSADATTFIVGAPFNDANSNITNLDLGHVRAFKNPRSTNAPTLVPTTQPTKSPSNVPTKLPMPTKCGIFGLNFFCPLRGKCGFFRRLLKVKGCE